MWKSFLWLRARLNQGKFETKIKYVEKLSEILVREKIGGIKSINKMKTTKKSLFENFQRKLIFTEIYVKFLENSIIYFMAFTQFCPVSICYEIKS